MRHSPRTARLNLHLRKETKGWLEDEARRRSRKDGRHVRVSEVVEDALAFYIYTQEEGSRLHLPRHL